MSKDSNYISVGSWMFIMFVTAIPCIGWVMILIWALGAENETQRNYFRAMIAWCLVITAIYAVIVLFTPESRAFLHTWLEQHRIHSPQ